MSDSFFTYQQKVQAHIEIVLESFLAKEPDSTLKSAMHYSLLNGGKRIRPLLVYAVADMFNLPWSLFDSTALSVELIHTYSLIHDDLPAMDNDDFRRGLLTCHKQFNEAQAILAGDALQAEAFELLAFDSKIEGLKRLELIQILSFAIGAKGLCLGQSKDLESENHLISLSELIQIHQNKTGKLLEAAMSMSLILVDNLDNKTKISLNAFAQMLGLAFQIKDDILDVIGTQSETGKKQGSDAALDKSTYPSLLTLEGAKIKLAQLQIDALAQLSDLNQPTSRLKQLLDFVVHRNH